MEKLFFIALPVFFLTVFLYWKLTREYSKKAVGEKMWEQWSTRTLYWHGAIMICGGITVGILFLLKRADVLAF